MNDHEKKPLILKTLGGNLKSVRIKKELSKGAVARAIKASRHTVAMIEVGKHNLTFELFDKICKFYNVKHHEMLK